MDQRIKTAIILSLAVLAALLVGVYTYLYVQVLPDIGFLYNQRDGKVLSVDSDLGSLIRPGDQIQRLEGVSYADYTQGTRPSLLKLINGQASLSLDVLRQGRFTSVRLPAGTPAFGARLLRLIEMLPAILLLAVEVISLLFLRPLDTRWSLIAAALSLTAVWLAAMTVQPYNLMGSTTLARVLVWLCMPMYLHFSWYFPQPLGRPPRLVIGAIYLAGAGLAGLEILRRMPPEAFLYGLLVSMAGGLTLLLLHQLTHPALRGDIHQVALFLSIVLLPAIIGTVASFRQSTHSTSMLITFSLPGAPLVILFAVYRRQLGGQELRANQAFIIFQFSMLLLAVCVGIVTLLTPLFRLPGAAPIIAVVMSIVMGGIGALGYPYFRRWAQKRLLKIPLLSDQLLHSYAGRITTSMEAERLAQILVRDVFPTLLVRQGALLHLDEALTPEPVALLGIGLAELPERAEIPDLLQSAGVAYTPKALAVKAESPLPHGWVRLALALKVEGRPVGLCLLGRRDPDDFYSMVEIPRLQSLMDQTALALYNVEQAERLRMLLQANLERDEAERMHLARELHDDVLGQMALLAMNMPEGLESIQYQLAFQTATDRVRAIVNGLRPTTIAYGLPIAFRELADELTAQLTSPVEIAVQLPASPARYPEELEMHLYRIVQQACQNAILHGQASRIEISGALANDQIELRIQDNGRGFEVGAAPNLTDLLARRHFGLAGIFERAALIHASARIDSTPGAGTRISLTWRSAGR